MKLEIKPRWRDGVPWCDAECPQCDLSHGGFWQVCLLGTGPIRKRKTICLHAVRRMAVENEAWRGGRLKYHSLARKWYLYEEGPKCSAYFNTIDAAVDALIEEREE